MLRKLRLWISKKAAGDMDLDIAGNKTVSEAELHNTMASILLADILKERRSERRWKLFRRFMIASFFIGGAVLYAMFYTSTLGIKVNIFERFKEREPELAVVRISGTIGELVTADTLIPAIRSAFEAKTTKAVVLQINSPGGAPGDAERIGSFVREMRLSSEIPIHAVIEGIGASAAYLIAMETDSIYAGRYSLVGSIGAVLSAWEAHQLLDRIGVQQRTFSSGELKSMLNPFAPPNEEGNAKAQSLVDEMGEMFREDLMLARAKKLTSGIDYGTGEVWNGVVAQEIGLVDEIGTIESIQSKYGLEKLRVYRPFRPYSFMRMMAEWAQDMGMALPWIAEGYSYELR